MTQERLTSIQCRSCAAPLDLKGGHTVRSLTCTYCGAVMDAQADFAVLERYANLERPDTPFAIGMEGHVKGVRFVVIGTIGYASRDQWGVYPWVSHQLFSPTHGYAWITWNDGHFVFTRRVRDLPQPALPTGLARKQRVQFRGETFRVIETYEAAITFVEGELTWVARLRDKAKVTEAIAPPLLLEYERTSEEIEYGLSEYLPRDEVVAAFGLDKPMSAPSGIHPAQPYGESAVTTAWRKVAWYGAIAAGAAALFVWIVGAGITVLDTRVADPSRDMPPLEFTLTRPSQLVRLELTSPVDNSWIFYDVVVTDEDDEPILALGSEISYYHGYDDGAWSEGSQTASALFRLPEAGTYRLEIERDPESPAELPLRVEVSEGAMPVRWFLGLFVLLALSQAWLWWQRQRFEKRRWGEEDDD